MLHYPKIPGSRNAPDGKCIAFEKYDGTNLHWDWERDFGWHAFGTRRDSFNLTPDGIGQFADQHGQLAEAPEVFLSTLAGELEQVFLEVPSYRECRQAKVFTEFLGPNSFAGLHRDSDPKELILFDVSIDTDELISPFTFVEDFGHLRIARVVYEGRLTGKFAEEIRTGKYGVNEGVICKGGSGEARWMVKIKTYEYLERLKQAFADRWEDYWE